MSGPSYPICRSSISSKYKSCQMKEVFKVSTMLFEFSNNCSIFLIYRISNYWVIKSFNFINEWKARTGILLYPTGSAAHLKALHPSPDSPPIQFIFPPFGQALMQFFWASPNQRKPFYECYTFVFIQNGGCWVVLRDFLSSSQFISFPNFLPPSEVSISYYGKYNFSWWKCWIFYFDFVSFYRNCDLLNLFISISSNFIVLTNDSLSFDIFLITLDSLILLANSSSFNPVVLRSRIDFLSLISRIRLSATRP